MTWKRLVFGAIGFLFFCASVQAVNYRVTFDATWTDSNHPGNYPRNAHFSTPIGTTHNDSVSFWAPGGVATPGIEGVAETGSVRLFREEIGTAIQDGNAFGFAQGATFNSPGSNRLGFEAVEQFPLVSLVSMIAPSPDWFVGVHDLSLRDENGWVDSLVVPLAPYDAGTESGAGFSLSNPGTVPKEPIRRLDEDSSSILFEANSFGTFTFELLPVCDLNFDDRCNAGDLNSNSGLYSVGDLTVGIPVVLGQNSRFDLNGDLTIDGRDIDAWLAMAAEHNGFAEPYLRGDTNLNDHVGFGDFTSLSRGFGNGVEWTDGNYDGSPRTDFNDFLALSGNFGKQISRQAGSAAVPEPSGRVLLLSVIACFLQIARRTRQVR